MFEPSHERKTRDRQELKRATRSDRMRWGRHEEGAEKAAAGVASGGDGSGPSNLRWIILSTSSIASSPMPRKGQAFWACANIPAPWRQIAFSCCQPRCEPVVLFRPIARWRSWARNGLFLSSARNPTSAHARGCRHDARDG